MINFPPDYPSQAPEVYFVTPILHLNVDRQGKVLFDVALDLLKRHPGRVGGLWTGFVGKLRSGMLRAPSSLIRRCASVCLACGYSVDFFSRGEQRCATQPSCGTTCPRRP